MSLKIGAYTSLPANGLFKFKFVDLMKYYSSTQSGKPCLGTPSLYPRPLTDP